MTELIDWVEEQARENLKFRLNCLENILKECNTTLTLLLAGLGANTAYIFKLLNTTPTDRWLLFGSIGLFFYLLFLSSYLIIKCLKIDTIQVPTNEPKNLYQKEYTLLQLREVELKNIQIRIEKQTKRNLKTAVSLNAVRMGILGSPIIFTFVAVFYL